MPPAAIANDSTASADHIEGDVSRSVSFVRWVPLVSMPLRRCCDRLPAPVLNCKSEPRPHRSSNHLWVIVFIARPSGGQDALKENRDRPSKGNRLLGKHPRKQATWRQSHPSAASSCESNGKDIYSGL
jgi:hypothetical protein